MKQKVQFWTSAIIIPTFRMKHRACDVTLLIFFVFAVEHTLYLVKTLLYNQQTIKNCQLNASEFFHSYLIAYRYHLTSAIPYHIMEFPIYQWINILMTFAWNFVDLFVILISIALATRFNQINLRIIDSLKSAAIADTFWSDIRLHYYELVELVEAVDHKITVLIFISTGHNLFSVCVVIFESLTR